MAETVFRFDRAELRLHTRELCVDGAPVPLGARAFDLLQALVTHRDRLLTKHELLEMVWPKLVVEENNLQVQVSTLRKLLGSKAIATVPGRGYRFAAPLVDAARAAVPPAPTPYVPAPPASRGHVGNLRPGHYEVDYQLTWNAPVNDGFDDFGPGTDNPIEANTCNFNVLRNPDNGPVSYTGMFNPTTYPVHNITPDY